jgi:tetratricopeptide (TPR) repeat protein
MLGQLSRRVLIAAALALSSGAVAGCNQERNESIRLMNEGIKLYRSQKVHKAVATLAEAVKADPTNDRAIYFEGMIRYQKLGQVEPGEKLLRRAVELNKQEADYHYHLGAALAIQARHREAVDLFDQCVALKGDHAEAHLRRGLSLESLERYDDAQGAYREAIKANPRLAEAYNALGTLYFRFEQYGHAAQVLRNAVQNVPEFAQNYHDLGLVYQAQKRYEDAIAQLQRAIELDPAQPAVLFNLGMTHMANDNAAEGIKQLKRYLAQRTATEDPVRSQTAKDLVARYELGEGAP